MLRKILVVCLLVYSAKSAIGDTFPLCWAYPGTFPTDMKATSTVLDLNKYSGKWYEQFHILPSYSPQQRGCTCTTADYTVNSDNTIKVENRCLSKGKIGGIDGKLEIKNAPQNTQGYVYFFQNFLKGDYWITGGNYWILDIANDYSWAVIGEPCLRQAYFLTRERNPNMDQIEEKKKYLVNTHGYVLDNFSLTSQQNCTN